MKKITKVKSIYLFLIKWISQNKILTIILILAAILRYVGIYPGFPPTHSDETYIYGDAIKMIKNLNIDPIRYDYPAFIPLIHAILYMIIFNPLFIIYSLIFAPDNLPNFKNIIFFFQNVILYNQTIVIFWGRIITASFGVGIVYISYLVGKSYFSKNIGLVVAFLVGINFRQVLNSHISLPDIYNAFFLLVSLYFLKNLLDRPNRKNYLLAGLSSALFFCTKSQVFPLLTFGLINFFIIWRETQSKKILSLAKNFFNPNFILACLSIPLLYLTINIYQFINWDKFYNINRYTTLQYRFGINNLDIYSISYLYHVGIGPIISIFAILGIILGFKKSTIPTLIFLSIILPFFYLFVYYSNGGFYTRNFVTITPLLLIFTGLFVVEISQLIGQKLKLRQNYINYLIVLIVLVISWESIKNSIISVYYLSQSQNYQIAKTWAINNIPDKAIVAARTTDKFPKKKQIKIINFEYNDVFTLAEMQENNVEYGYIPLDGLNGSFYWWMRQSTLEALSFWNKNITDSISNNMFAAKVAKELSSWSVAFFIKPWQSPDVNYFVIKVPKKIELNKNKIIRKFSFEKKEDMYSWFKIFGNNTQVNGIVFDSEVGNSKKGSVRINKSQPDLTSINIIRIVSPVIVLDNTSGENKAYKLTGWIKIQDVLEKKEQDGYLSIDFYETDPKTISLTTGSFNTALSSRVFGTSDWVQKTITVIAPKNAKFMTISLEIGNPGKTNIWFDDLILSESEGTFDDPKTKYPYLNYYQIPENILFPLSHGGW